MLSLRQIRGNQARKIGGVAPRIPRRDRISGHGRVCADEEIAEDIVFPAPLPAVANERLAGEMQRRAGYLDQRQATGEVQVGVSVRIGMASE